MRKTLPIAAVAALGLVLAGSASSQAASKSVNYNYPGGRYLQANVWLGAGQTFGYQTSTKYLGSGSGPSKASSIKNRGVHAVSAVQELDAVPGVIALIRLVTGMLFAALLAVSLLAVVALTQNMCRQRAGDIAILKTYGWSRSRIQLLLTSETALVCAGRPDPCRRSPENGVKMRKFLPIGGSGTRRSVATLLAGAVVAVAAAGCGSGVSTYGWTGSEVLAVSTISGTPFLVAARSAVASPLPAEDLKEFGVEAYGQPRILRSGARRLLAWNTGDGPMRFAVLDPATASVRRLDYKVNTGMMALEGDRLYTLRPASGSGAVIDVYDLGTQRPAGTVRLPFFPEALIGSGQGQVAALAGTEGGSRGLLIETSTGRTTPEFTLRGEGAVTGASVAGDRLVVALGRSSSAQQLPAGRPVVLSGPIGKDLLPTVKIANPGPVETVDRATVVLADLVKGQRTVQIVDVSSGRIRLASRLISSAPVQDLIAVSSHQVVALQSDGWTLVDTADGRTRSLELPGTVISTS